jgi:hypothetical protein
VTAIPVSQKNIHKLAPKNKNKMKRVDVFLNFKDHEI